MNCPIYVPVFFTKPRPCLAFHIEKLVNDWFTLTFNESGALALSSFSGLLVLRASDIQCTLTLSQKKFVNSYGIILPN